VVPERSARAPVANMSANMSANTIANAIDPAMRTWLPIVLFPLRRCAHRDAAARIDTIFAAE
jgi:hypothetical protein